MRSSRWTFALFSHIPWPEEHAPKRLYADLTEQAIIGEELGFKAIWLAEHHFTRYGLGASSLVIASNIAARTNHIRLGTAVLIPPLHHPVRLAEDTATLDVLSDGRLDVGFGRGAAASEYVNFGVDHAESQARYRETIEMVESLWTTPDYSFEGDYYSAHRLNLVPTPLQQPHPPVHVAATRSVESLEFVSTTGRRLIIGVVLNTGEAVELLKRFLDMAQQSGSPVTAADVPFFRYFYVAETEEEAHRDAHDALNWTLGRQYLAHRIPGGQRGLPTAGRLPANSYQVSTDLRIPGRKSGIHRQSRPMCRADPGTL